MSNIENFYQNPTQSAEKIAKKVILDLGPGCVPLLSASHPDVATYAKQKNKVEPPTILNENEIYLGIEHDQQQAQGAKNAIDLTHNLACIKGKWQIISGEGEYLPVKENSVDQVFIRNIFSDPHFIIDIFRINDFRHITRRIEPIIKELARVMKKNGTVVIMENYTAQFSRPEYIIRLFTDNCFRLQKFIKAQSDNDSNFNQALRELGKITPNVITSQTENYILEFIRSAK